MAQDLLGCEAIADTGAVTCAYGIVTDYLSWVFIRSLDSGIEMHTATLEVEGCEGQ